MRIFLTRATLLVALSFFSPSLPAQTKAIKSETYKDIIEKAYNLSLQRDRQQALNILASAIKRETRPSNILELKKTMSEVATVFFSDKVQQLYETGVSLSRGDVSQAYEKILEAARVEPDNSLIVVELARLMIARGDCKGAFETVRKQAVLVPYDEDLKLAQAQAWACQSKWAEYQKILDSVSLKKSSLQKFWYALEAQRFLDLNNPAKCLESLNQLRKIDDKYPELFYWTWKLSRQQKKSKPEEAQKYVMTCKNISANQYRQYMIDPMLCRRVNEVEGELRGINGTPD